MGAIISNFMEIILGKYAQFKGRAGRSEFWMFYLVLQILNQLILIVSVLFSDLITMDISIYMGSIRRI